MTDVDGRELPFSVTCPDCGCVCARGGEYGGGLTKHRGSMHCQTRANQRRAEADGLVQVINATGLLADADIKWERRPTKAIGGDLRLQTWVPKLYGSVINATHGWNRKARIAALRIAKDADDDLRKALDFCAETGDLVGLRTFLEANLPHDVPRTRRERIAA